MATYILIHGAGSEAWYWHRVVPHLEARGHTCVVPDLPCDDDSAGVEQYADAVIEALDDEHRHNPGLVVVAQSMAGFTAPLVCERVPVDLLILLAAMIPAPGERMGDWWKNTHWKQAANSRPDSKATPASRTST